MAQLWCIGRVSGAKEPDDPREDCVPVHFDAPLAGGVCALSRSLRPTQQLSPGRAFTARLCAQPAQRTIFRLCSLCSPTRNTASALRRRSSDAARRAHNQCELHWVKVLASLDDWVI